MGGASGLLQKLEQQVQMEKAVGMKKDEEREWVMGPTNIAVSIPLSLAVAGGTASGHR